MENVRLIENGLIPVYQNESGKQLVSAKELHNFLVSKQDFSNWIRKRLEECDAVEDEDFSINLLKSIGGRPSKEYLLVLDLAKEVAMLERNKKGKEVRKYFIDIEKKYKTKFREAYRLSLELQMLKQLVDTVKDQQQDKKKLEAEIISAKEKLTAVLEIISINVEEDWRGETNKLMAKICERLNNYQLPKERAYSALEKRARCSLKRRLNNMRAKLLLKGVSISKASALNYLDVIAEDVKLKEIYISIVKELSVKYEAAV